MCGGPPAPIPTSSTRMTSAPARAPCGRTRHRDRRGPHLSSGLFSGRQWLYPGGFGADAADRHRTLQADPYLTGPCKMIRLDPAETWPARSGFRQFSSGARRPPPSPAGLARRRQRRRRTAEIARVVKAVRRWRGAASPSRRGRRCGGNQADSRYLRWINYYDHSEQDRPAIEARLRYLATTPLISVLMPVYNTPPDCSMR